LQELFFYLKKLLTFAQLIDLLLQVTNNESLAIISLLAYKICELQDLCVSKDKTIAEQKDTIAKQASELAQKGHPKNSGNSSLPPSSDFAPPKRNQSLREPTNKKPGGQPGHEGQTLKMSEEPDEIIVYPLPCRCGKCGIELADFKEELIEERQVVEIPPIRPIYKAHRTYRKKCSCGYINESAFPAEVNAPIQYGSSVTVQAVYLHSRQFIPYDRMSEFFEHVMHLPISQGTLNNMVHRFAQKATPAYEAIKLAIQQSEYVGADETGCKVDGEKHWFWGWQNDRLTFIIHSESRGYDTVELTFPDGLPNAIIGSDRWAAQLKCAANGRQICTAHLQRDLNFVEQVHDSQWAKDFKGLISDAQELKNQLTECDYANPMPARDALEKRLEQLLVQPIPAAHNQAITLQKSLTKLQQYILKFLYHVFVPADNNGSERAVRNIKVKQKVSGQFKSTDGAKDFAVIRSIIDTAIKLGNDVFDELIRIANLVPASG